LQSSGDPALIYYWRGRTLILAADPSAALEAFDIARGEPGAPEDLELFAAEAYLQDNQPERAIEALSRLIGSTLNPLLRAQAMLRRAQIYESLDPPDLESALVDYQAVLGQPELPEEMRRKAQEGTSRLEATPTPTAIPPGN
jgi:tetratricopeptide (TPR) repeat protein